MQFEESSTHAAPRDLPAIEHRYLLVVPIPYFVGDDGSMWMDRLWHHDFIAHLKYLKRLTLASPRRPLPANQSDLVRVDLPPGADVHFVALPEHDSHVGALVDLPKMLLTMGKAVRESDIVHSGVVGWPYPIGWIANAFTWLHRRKLIIVIESAPWRLNDGQPASARHKAKAAMMEWAAQFCTNRADLGIFSQPGYRDTLMRRGAGMKIVTPATWINANDVLTNARAEQAWNAKAKPLRVLFAGRMLAEKGIRVLLDAAERLQASGADVVVDFIGEGPLRDEIAAAARARKNVRLLDPRPYGAPFFELVREYHAVVVPSMSDEQPRIVFDAYSQAVPVIASSTTGLSSIVEDGVTGTLVPPGDAQALASALQKHAAAPERLREMSRHALERAQSATHEGMHSHRWSVLLDCFGPR